MSKAASWSRSRKLIRARQYTMGKTLRTLFYEGGTVRLEVFGGLLNVFNVPESDRSIMIRVQRGYSPCVCV